jgi:tetratricopeptide (TPR) repeat protein
MRVAAFAAATLLAGGCASAFAEPKPYADFLVGSYAERARDPDAAWRRFDAALRLSPRDPRLLQGAADAALAAGAVEAAAQYGRRADGLGHTVASGRLAAAAVALRDGRAGQAATLVRGLEGAPVEQLAAGAIGVWALAAAGRADAAQQGVRLEGAAPRAAWSALHHYQRAMLHEHAGRDDEAAAADARGDAAGGLRIAQVAVLQGALLERLGRGDDARALYGRFLEGVDNPGVCAAAERLARGAPPPPAVEARQGAAISLFAIAVLVGSDPLGQEDLTPLALAMALDPGFEGARLAFADTMRNAGRGEAARAALAGIAPSSPYYETARAQIAFSLRRDGRSDEAIALLRADVDAGGGRMVRRALADLYRAAERYAEAEPLYAGLIAEQGASNKDWRLDFAHGVTLERLGRWPEAEARLRAALAIAPDQPEVLNYLGYQWVDSGARVAEGLEILQRAVAQRPDEGYIVDSLGWAYYRLGQYARAVEILERAVELSPGDATLNDHLGDAYWRVGRRIEARFQWRRVLSLQATPAERTAAEKKLAEGLPPP